MTSISLKINLISEGRVKTLPFTQNQNVLECAHAIVEKTEVGSVEDFGLFVVDIEESGQGRWLSNSQTLAYYDLKTGDELIWKKKVRPLKVILMDDSTKKVMIDETLPVTELVKILGKKSLISKPEEYSLCHQVDGKDVWLAPNQSLSEQDISDDTQLRLKKKFFYSDGEINRNDPVALNLLYVQTRDTILDGTHPVTEEEATQFAALMLQILFGNHDPTKHKKNFIKVKDFVPQEHIKAKDIEKAIYQEHKKLVGMSEINAKYRYVQLCRSLKTYGVTFFRVKDSATVKGRKQLVPRLLGITRESILRMDPETKTVMHHYPLTHLRRWAGTPTTFTFDFGDYEDSYYTVQTDQADEIGHLISGYIDLILQKRKAAAMGESNSEMVAEEDTVSGAMGHSASHAASASAPHAGQAVRASVGTAHGAALTGGAQKAVMSGAQSGTKASGIQATGAFGANCQRELSAAMAANVLATQRLAETPTSPDLSLSDPNADALRMERLKKNRQDILGACRSISHATGVCVNELVGASNVDTVDVNDLAKAFKMITDNVPGLIDGVRGAVSASAAGDPNIKNLLEAARVLSKETSRLVMASNTSAATLAAGMPDPRAREDILSAAQVIGAAISQLLGCSSAQEVDVSKQQAIIDAAKAVAAATTNLVGHSKNCAAKMADPNSQQGILNGARGTANSTSQLVACCKVAAPTVNHPPCLNEVARSMESLRSSRDGLLSAADAAKADPDSLNALALAAKQIEEALRRLKGSLDDAQKGRFEEFEGSVLAIKAATAELCTSRGDPKAIVACATKLATNSAALVNSARGASGAEPDPIMQKQLLAAAKAIADATQGLVVRAKVSASDPASQEKHQAMEDAAAVLNAAAGRLLADAQRRLAFKMLAEDSRKAIDAISEVMRAGRVAAPHNRIPKSQQAVDAQSREVSLSTGNLLSAVNKLDDSSTDPTLQTQLVLAAKNSVPPSARLLQCVQAAAPHISDPKAQQDFAKAAFDAAQALKKLSGTVKIATEASGFIELDAAVDKVNSVSAEVDAMLIQANMDMLTVDPELSAFDAHSELKDTTKLLATASSALLSAASQGAHEKIGPCAKNLGDTVARVIAASKNVAKSTSSSSDQQLVLTGAKATADVVASQLQDCKEVLASPMLPENNKRLTDAAKSMQNALSRLVSSLPGVKDCDDALNSIRQSSAELNPSAIPAAVPGQTFTMCSNDLQALSRDLADAIDTLAKAAVDNNPDRIAIAARIVSQSVQDVVDAGQNLAATLDDVVAQNLILDAVRQLTNKAANAVLAAKAVAANAEDAALQQQLSTAAKSLADSLSTLATTTKNAAPGMRELEEALATLEAARTKIGPPNEIPVGVTYMTVSDSLQKGGRELALATANLVNKARQGKPEQTGIATKQACASLGAMATAATVVAGIAGGQHPGPAVRKYDEAHTACSAAIKEMLDAKDPKGIIQAAAAVARLTSELVADAKKSASLQKDGASKRLFLDGAKEVANHTTSVVTAAKKAALQPSADSRQSLAVEGKALREAVGNLCKTAAKRLTNEEINEGEKHNQESILDAAARVTTQMGAMVECSRAVIAAPRDSSCQNKLASSSRAVAEAISGLLRTVRSKAPGQQACETAVQALQSAIGEMDTALINATVGALEMPEGSNPDHQAHIEELLTLGAALPSSIASLADASKSSPSETGASALKLVDPTAKLSNLAVAAAATTADQSLALRLIDLCKGVADGLLNVVNGSRAASVSNEEPAAAKARDDAIKKCNGSIEELVSTLRAGVSAQRECDVALSDITSHLALLDQPTEGAAADLNFTQLQGTVGAKAKEFAKQVALLLQKAKTQPDSMGAAASTVSAILPDLVRNTQKLALCCSDEDLQKDVDSALRTIANNAVEMVRCAKAVAGSPNDNAAQQSLSTAARGVSDAIAKLLEAAKNAATGERQTEEAIQALNAAMTDLETQAMFAEQEAEGSTLEERFSSHLPTLTKTVDEMTTLLPTLVAASANQKELGSASTALSKKLSSLLESAKLAATTVHESGPRKGLYDVVRNVANAIAALAHSSQAACRQGPESDAASMLHEQQLEAEGSLTSAVNALNRIGDDLVVGEKATAETSSAIKAAAAALDDGSAASAAPEEAVEAARIVAQDTANVVTATKNGQAAMVAASQKIAATVQNMLLKCKGAAKGASDDAAKSTMLAAARAVASAMCSLLDKIVDDGPKILSQDAQTDLAGQSKAVADSIKGVIDAARTIKGELFELEDNDPNSVAERELHAAARAIEAAAKKLLALKPKRPESDAAEEVAFDNMSFEDVLVHACQDIASATGNLVKHATTAQHEIVQSGKASTTKAMYHADAAWSDGLISAAKAVASATGNLAEQANLLCKAEAEDIAMIAAAKAVSASTVQLVTASRAKADPNSSTQQKLSAAARSVSRATETLVKNAQDVTLKEKSKEEEEEKPAKKMTAVQAKMAEMEAQMKVLQLEKDLEAARRAITDRRKAAYKGSQL